MLGDWRQSRLHTETGILLGKTSKSREVVALRVLENSWVGHLKIYVDVVFYVPLFTFAHVFIWRLSFVMFSFLLARTFDQFRVIFGVKFPTNPLMAHRM